MMTRLRRTRLLLVVVGIAGWLCYVLWPREPVYQGRRLSAWLQDLVDYQYGSHDEREEESRQEAAVAAVRSMGRSAEPWLVSWLRASPDPLSLRDKLQTLLEKQDYVKLELPERRDRSRLAIAGFGALGPAATNTLPDLGRLLLDPRHSRSVIECLYGIGPAAFSVAVPAITNSDPSVQAAGVWFLTEFGPEIGPRALPVFVDAITNKASNTQSQSRALLGLGDLGPVARPVKPWIESMMQDPSHPPAGIAMRVIAEIDDKPGQHVALFSDRLADTNLTEHAAFALARAGPDGVPSLLQGLTNANPVTRDAVFVALGSEFSDIAPAIGPSKYRFSIRSLRFDSQCNLRRLRWSATTQFNFEPLALALRLSEHLDHPDSSVRLHLVQLLASQGHHAAPGLWRAAQDESEGVRKAARQALLVLGVEVQEGAIIRGPKDQRQIALVFTGHEYAESAESILETLARHRAEASFFLTGVFLTNTAFRPVIERLYRDGHYLGPHSDQHLLYCPWQGPKTTLITRRQFVSDLTENLTKLHRLGVITDSLPRYFVPPYEHFNLEIVQWACGLSCVTVNLTPGTRSAADYTGEADANFVASQVILDSIIAREQQDEHGLNGYILLFHVGAGPGRADKFHARFGELLEYLAGKGYRFVAIDQLLDPEAAAQRRSRQRQSMPTFDARARDEAAMKAFRKRYGLDR